MTADWKAKFKMGDLVRVKSGSITNNYKIGHEFIVNKISSGVVMDNPIYFPLKGNGMYETDLELAKIHSWREAMGDDKEKAL